MSPLFDEDSLGARLAEKATTAMDGARYAEDPFVEDPEALALAEAEVSGIDPEDDYENLTADWVVAFGPRSSAASSTAQDSPPGCSRPRLRPPTSRTFGIRTRRRRCPASVSPTGRSTGPSRSWSQRTGLRKLAHCSRQGRQRRQFGLPADVDRTPEVRLTRRRWSWVFFWVFIGLDLALVIGYAVLKSMSIVG